MQEWIHFCWVAFGYEIPDLTYYLTSNEMKFSNDVEKYEVEVSKIGQNNFTVIIIWNEFM